MTCQLVQISPKHLDNAICTNETVSLRSTECHDNITILTEAGILPQNFSRVEYCICTAHFSQLLKENEMRKRRQLCMLPSALSSHPAIDHTCTTTMTGRRSLGYKRKSSKFLSEKDVYIIQKYYGIVMAVNTRKYFICICFCWN